MRIETDSNIVIVVACLSVTAVIIAGIMSGYKYNASAIKNGYSEVQQQGSHATMWVAPATNSTAR